MNIQIVLEILITIIGLYLAFFKSYFQEKGKNLATTEDIEEITEKVEMIKNEILYSTQTKLSLKTEERISLVNCYDKYNYWLSAIVDTYFGGINEENKSKLKEIEEKLNDAKFQYNLAEGRMELFVNNDEISKLIRKLRKETLAMQHLFETYSGKVDYVFFEISHMKATTPIEKQIEFYSPLLDKRKEIILEFYKKKEEMYGTIAPMEKTFQTLIYKHLQTLIEK